MSCLVRATRLTLRGFQRHQPLPERLLLFPPCGYVTNDGHGSEHLAITIRGEDDGELDGDPPPVAPACGNCQHLAPVAGDTGPHDGAIPLPVARTPTLGDDQVERVAEGILLTVTE